MYVCRFHLYRTLERLWGNDPDWPFDDEVHLQENPRPEWRSVGYQYAPRANDAETNAETILADSVRCYCQKHLPAHKNDLRRILGPVKFRDASLCTCNPLDRFGGIWLCSPCFEKERSDAFNRSKTRCCELDCNRPADLTWKQCCLCKRLKMPFCREGIQCLEEGILAGSLAEQ